MDRYVYAGDSPVNLTDPSGRETLNQCGRDIFTITLAGTFGGFVSGFLGGPFAPITVPAGTAGGFVIGFATGAATCVTGAVWDFLFGA
jgi:hypothetical protein